MSHCLPDLDFCVHVSVCLSLIVYRLLIIDCSQRSMKVGQFVLVSVHRTIDLTINLWFNIVAQSDCVTIIKLVAGTVVCSWFCRTLYCYEGWAIVCYDLNVSILSVIFELLSHSTIYYDLLDGSVISTIVKIWNVTENGQVWPSNC